MKFGILAAISCAIISQALGWSINDGSYSLVRGGNAFVTGSFEDSLPPLDIDARSSLELSFLVSDKNKSNKPHQISLMIIDPSTGLEFGFPATLRGSKATIRVPHQKIPAVLRDKPLETKLIVASFEGEPFSKILTTKLTVDKAGTYERPARFSVKPEITHIFKPNPKPVSETVAILATGVVISLLVNLIIAWFVVGANLSSLGKAFQGSFFGHGGLLLSLATFEVVFFLYYLSMSIFDAITIGAVLAPIAVFTGSRALREVNRRRIAGDF